MTPLRAALAASGSRQWREWVSHAAGMAGVPDHHFAAYMLVHAGRTDPASASDGYARIVRLPLLESAIKLKQRERWPDKIRGRKYIEGLVGLCLDEILSPRIRKVNGWYLLTGPDYEEVWVRPDHMPASIKAVKWDEQEWTEPEWKEGWWRRRINLNPSDWRKQAEKKYEAIRSIAEAWANSAKLRMRGPLTPLDGEVNVWESSVYGVLRTYDSANMV